MVKYDQRRLQRLQALADRGDRTAQFDLGETYDIGHPRNLKKAAHWYRIAGERGDKHALNNLGYLYEHGRGVPKDHQKAWEYYRRSADKGNVIAVANLGVLMHQQRKYRRALIYFERAVASGDEASKVYIEMYRK